MGGIRRGEHAALPNKAAHSHPQRRIFWVEYGMKLPTCNGTQNPLRRDPEAVTRLTTRQCSRAIMATPLLLP